MWRSSPISRCLRDARREPRHSLVRRWYVMPSAALPRSNASARSAVLPEQHRMRRCGVSCCQCGAAACRRNGIVVCVRRLLCVEVFFKSGSLAALPCALRWHPQVFVHQLRRCRVVKRHEYVVEGVGGMAKELTASPPSAMKIHVAAKTLQLH